jgi:hypothetical protein
MKTQLLQILLPICGIILGGVIGFIFGSIQNAALARHRKLQKEGDLKSGWSIMPGSMRRTAFLLAIFGAVQLACPMFFDGSNIQWLVSAGVVIGYGWTLLQQLRHHEFTRV